MADRLTVFDAKAAVTLGIVNILTEVRGSEFILKNPLASSGCSREESIRITANSVSVRELETALKRLGARQG
jgi:hypothetical protein